MPSNKWTNFVVVGAVTGAVVAGAAYVYQNFANPKSTKGSNKSEKTYIMIKPDGVQRGLVGEIVTRFEEKGFKLVAFKMMKASRQLLEKHYSDLKGKKFFSGLITYMLSGPVVCMVWEGTGAVKTGRVMLGATDPAKSVQGSIRGDLCISVGKNICHGSDSVNSAKSEIALWFPEGKNTDPKVCDWVSHHDPWIYEAGR